MTNTDPKTILILGGTSHIAKGLIAHFLADSHYRIEWFGRSRQRMEAFLRNEGLSGNISIHEEYDSLFEIRGNALINCVGAGTPAELNGDYTLWFTVLEKYDNLCLDYLKQVNPSAFYIDFSSGAVYGRNQSDTFYSIDPNSIGVADYYSLAKIYSEAKHRAFYQYNIVDIRIFSYFSRYANLSSGYLITDILKAIVDNSVLKTSNTNVIRDYISPDDLFALVVCCISQAKINKALDAFSAKSVSKREIIASFCEDFGLKFDCMLSDMQSINATSSVYVPREFSARTIGYAPAHTSLDALRNEARIIIEKQ